eukprot:gnl/MRDRNA2_/MRDRNA2_98976_c0_seq1.p1 gnl/MRDRNA2_/MRDRNA2_98976_c0~~gnl/MRDRNA2_/MRDRNA2_98976_c0_seq1.p1  ORF type:complete len:424 (+),score=77.12 gnl/MRDRNA2_/MRDRNA2_98976_c0_seq1:74-1345(+)
MGIDTLGEFRIKTIAFFSLVAIQTCVGITYKLSTQGSKGFAFSTTSAVTISEFAKLVMAFVFHMVDHWRRPVEESAEGTFGFAHKAMGTVAEQLDRHSVFHILCMSFLYTVNNQMTFYIIITADPGSVFLFKAGSTMIVALTQWVLLGRQLHRLQWSALLLQFTGIIVVQYNPCLGRPLLPMWSYACLVFQVVVTALTTVRNEYIVKNFKIDLNVQNMVLYGGGFAMNLFAFCFLPNPNSSQAHIGLFDGYNTMSAKGVILSNAFIGIAISLVYKYADALVKMIATDCTTTILMVFSATVLGTPSTPLTWFGVMIVFVAIQQYGDAGKLFAEEQKREKEQSEKAKPQDLENPEKVQADNPEKVRAPESPSNKKVTLSSGAKLVLAALVVATLILAAIGGYAAMGSDSLPRKEILKMREAAMPR